MGSFTPSGDPQTNGDPPVTGACACSTWSVAGDSSVCHRFRENRIYRLLLAGLNLSWWREVLWLLSQWVATPLNCGVAAVPEVSAIAYVWSTPSVGVVGGAVDVDAGSKIGW